MNEQSNLKRTLPAAKRWPACILGCFAAFGAPYPLNAETPAATKIAVFDFELEDQSASASSSGERPAEISVLKEATASAKKLLADSGKYAPVDTSGADADAVKSRSLRDCDGCEARIALQMGAQQSLVGVVVKAEQAAYAVEILVRDAETGKVVFARRDVFLGGPTEWSSGVRSLLRHGLLSSQ